MSENPIMGVKEQQRRRARINRMKAIIIWTIAIWMLVSMIVCMFLGIKVFSLNTQVNKIYDFIVSASGNAKENQTSDHSIVQNTEIENVTEDNSSIQYVADISNLAQETDVHKVYLTFDDGPSESTDEILDILARYNVKATFFVVGKTDQHSLEMYKRIVEEGHTIGLHSYSHKYSTIYSSLEAYEEDLDKLNKLVSDTCGVETRILRFPGGSSNQVSDLEMKEFIRLVKEKGYTYYDWNVVSGDATSQSYTSQELVDNVINGVKKYETSIVLMHDATNKESTVEALSSIIEQLQEMKVQILPIDENTRVIQHVKEDTVD